MTNDSERVARQAELDALAAMPDDDIDTSDIPEMTDEQWASAVRFSDFQLVRELDKKVVGWFRAQASNPAQEINRVLRLHMEAAQSAQPSPTSPRLALSSSSA